MELFVCVKSVPDTDSITFDHKTGNLYRESSSSILNPYDMVAVEAGLRCVEDWGGNAAVVSMGPPSAEAGLRTALAMGAEKAYLLCDTHFSGADVLATSYTLAAFFKSKTNYDLIICGKHSADGDTGQTGAMLAEQLGIPHACGVYAPVVMENGFIIARQRLEKYMLTVRLPLPCLIIMENDAFYPRDITLPGIIRSKRQTIIIETAETIPDFDLSRSGSNGSATRVIKLCVPKHSRRGKIIPEDKLDTLTPLFACTDISYEAGKL